jgi:protoporphyrinogen oxidase
LLKTLFSAVGSWRDMFKILKLKLNLGAADLDTIFSRPEVSTRLYLQQMGFSQRIINQFFIPFFTGIFLEKNLDTSSRKFEFVFKMFSQAPAAVPAKGMGAIAKQLAAVLSANELLLNEQVIQIKDDEVFTFSGKILRAKAILIATAATGMPLPYTVQNAPGQTVTNLYFKTPKPPTQDAILMLNASENKVVNNLVVMDKVSKHYAPAGQSLLSVSLIGNWQGVPDDELIHRVLEELKQWFTDAPKWQHLKTYHIPYALPTDDTVSNNIEPDKLKLGRFHYICGDHLLNGSINAAIKSGRLAAELILNDIVS